MLCVPPLLEAWGHVAQMDKLLLSGPIHQESLTPQLLQPMYTSSPALQGLTETNAFLLTINKTTS